MKYLLVIKKNIYSQIGKYMNDIILEQSYFMHMHWAASITCLCSFFSAHSEFVSRKHKLERKSVECQSASYYSHHIQGHIFVGLLHANHLCAIRLHSKACIVVQYCKICLPWDLDLLILYNLSQLLISNNIWFVLNLAVIHEICIFKNFLLLFENSMDWKKERNIIYELLIFTNLENIYIDLGIF